MRNKARRGRLGARGGVGYERSVRKATTTHVFDCDVETFWKTYLDETYTKKLLVEVLGFPKVEVLDRTETSRKLRVVPKLALPAPVMKLVGDSFAYEDHGVLDRAANEWRYRVVPSALKDKLTTEGAVRVEPAGEGKCRRIDSVTIEARVFGLGSLIESSAEAEVKAGWAKEERFLREWLAGKR